MIVLDTDHASALGYPESARCQRLMSRLEAAGEESVGRVGASPPGHFRFTPLS